MRTFYFISDLHIGGDEALGVCDFEEELIEFLEMLAARADEDIELVIIGDAFGLWEFTQIEGKDKLDALITQFPRIFEAFRRTGEQIRITLLPGNHDYELACYPEFVDLLEAYNVHLEQNESITRVLDNRRLWIEHGSQLDQANRMPDYGNPHAQPIGYYVTSNLVGSAGQLSERGRYNWLKDIQSVYPTEDLPHWVLSNYFYREMSPFLRWVLLPFLLLFSVTLVVLAGAALERLGITENNYFLNNRLFESLGIVGSLLQHVLTINVVILTELLILALPVGLIVRDMQRTAKRFGLVLDPADILPQLLSNPCERQPDGDRIPQDRQATGTRADTPATADGVTPPPSDPGTHLRTHSALFHLLTRVGATRQASHCNSLLVSQDGSIHGFVEADPRL